MWMNSKKMYFSPSSPFFSLLVMDAKPYVRDICQEEKGKERGQISFSYSMADLFRKTAEIPPKLWLVAKLTARTKCKQKQHNCLALGGLFDALSLLQLAAEDRFSKTICLHLCQTIHAVAQESVAFS